MAETFHDVVPAPLEELIAILPKIQKAKERARLGTALEKATLAVERYRWMPARLEELSALLAATEIDKAHLRAEIDVTLRAVVTIGRSLAGELSIADLDNINQDSIAQLPLHVEKLVERIEALWRRSVQETLGGHATLGEVLMNIPELDVLARNLTHFAATVKRLEDGARPAKERVAEREGLVVESSALAGRLLEAGVAPPIAQFLVAVATRPVRLSELSDDILRWIKNHRALTLFFVSVRGTEAM